MIGTVVSAIAAIVMLIGVLFSLLFPLFRNYRRMYLFGAATAGAVFVVALGVLGVQSLIS